MKNKWLFSAAAFFSGMSVMAIELGASRLLAPYFSSSQIVWTIIIGTIMIAMAIGNVLGGRMADKNDSPDKLFMWLFAAATWTMLIPLVGKFVIAAVALVLASFVTTGYLVSAAFVSCILVFVFPLLILGMVTSNLVKYATSSLDESGRTVGKIEAGGTIGSIIGTFLPTFVTIPYVGTALTFVIFACVLYAVCIVYAVLRRKKFFVKAVIMLIALAGGIFSNGIGTAFWSDGLLYEGESIYNYLRVEEDSSSVILSTNVLFGVQSIKMKQKGLTGLYYDYALAAPIMAGAAENGDISVLILGLGTGTFATQCEYYFGITDIDGVETDEKIINLAYEYFELSDCVTTYTEDGRAYISLTDKTYDVIMVDAYQDITIPFQMSSVEFFTEVSEHLNGGGVMVVNMNTDNSTEGGINDCLTGTICSVFDSVYTIGAGTNIELFATDGGDCKQMLESGISSLDYSVSYFMNKVLAGLSEASENGLVLTDDKAPVEMLGMKALDDMISEELEDIKRSISGMSVKELFEYLTS